MGARRFLRAAFGLRASRPPRLEPVEQAAQAPPGTNDSPW